MELRLHRKYLKDSYTIGHLLVEGIYFCDTIEDKVRPLHSLADKVHGQTAIPKGRYRIVLDVKSNKFSKYSFYQEICNGYLPRLASVPFFDGILLHVADGYRGADLLEGCIGVGKNKIKGGLLYGKEVFAELYAKLEQAKKRGETIWITIS